MKPEELRIGNYYQWSPLASMGIPGPQQITHGQQIMDYIDLKEGIPLTEWWLKKMGFIDHKTFWSQTWGTNGVVIITYSQVYGSFMYQLAQSVDKTISTVHQLQNLFFALTGEELKTTLRFDNGF